MGHCLTALHCTALHCTALHCTALHPSPPPNLPSTHQPLRCAAQGVMTRQNNLLVSGVSNAGYAEFLGLDRYLLIDAKGFRCVHTHARS